MAQRANFASAPRCALGQIGTANTNRDGTGTGPATAIWTAPAAGAGPPVLVGGSKIEEIDVSALGTVTAGFVRIYVVDGAGANKRMIREIAVPATTPAVGVTPAWQIQLYFANLVLPATYFISASTQIGETFNIAIFGADF